jgi:Kef-type K+ transport system membrane component KefB
MVLPLIAGFFGAKLIGETTETSLFVGAALVATSVGITSAVLLDLKALKTKAARTILGAAVIDDVLALILLSIVVGIADTGGVDLVSILIVIGVSLAFLVFVGLGGTRVVRRWPDIFHAPKFAESPLLPAIILCLGLAAIAAQIGLAAIIGAFLAGMIVAETRDQHDFEKEVAPLYAFFPPFFFVFIGLQVELSAFSDPLMFGALIAVTVIAAVTKFAGAWIGARAMGARESLIVGVGMIPRGEVGIIVAGIGLTKGVIDGDLFTVIVGMSVLTTLIAPALLKMVLKNS